MSTRGKSRRQSSESVAQPGPKQEPLITPVQSSGPQIVDTFSDGFCLPKEHILYLREVKYLETNMTGAKVGKEASDTIRLLEEVGFKRLTSGVILIEQ